LKSGEAMSDRKEALKVATKRIEKCLSVNETGKRSSASAQFATRVFTRGVMQKMLPPAIYENLLNAANGVERIKPEHADTIAVALKEWATSHGATHYTHWFHPLTGSSAEKHDSFIEWCSPDQVIERFTGKQLLQGEPDASSFPSGGLRSTYEARGYTGWDPTSPAFVWQGGDGITLCIPSVFYSWTGDVLDSKIPLLRSDRKLSNSATRLLKLTGVKANYAYTTVGLEQEYFIIDHALKNARPDLLMCGRTVIGAPPPKGQELMDHYFGSVKDRILNFMHDVEMKALQLGIPVKTRHNEVAPAQHEVAPVYEKSSAAVDHNILLMEIMKRTANEHGLSCLLHEKPFHDLNGSGKHCNWSIISDTGINLFDPTELPENQLHFLILLTAVLNAIHEHASLLRAAIGTYSNDFRLGGHEAPPAIISVFLGEELEEVCQNIEHQGGHRSTKKRKSVDLDIPVIPELPKDNTDRNRTSPFAFTGNKFEIRAVGSSQNPAMTITVLNSIVSDSLNRILTEIEEKLKGGRSRSKKEVSAAAIPVLQKYLKKSKNIRFNGDNYSEEWIKTAEERGLPNLKKSIEAYESLLDKETTDVMEGVLKKEELKSRYEILSVKYLQMIDIEVNLILDLFKTHILPASIRYQKEFAKSILQTKQVIKEGTALQHQEAELQQLSSVLETAIRSYHYLEQARLKAMNQKVGKKKQAGYAGEVLDGMEKLRRAIDSLETLVADDHWSLPKYHELLFLV